LIINFYYGSLILKNNKKINETNLNFVIKIISPKIDINRFFEDESPEKIILELVKLSDPNSLEKAIFIFPEGVLSNIYLGDLKNYSYIFSENYSDQHRIIMGINSSEEAKVFNSMVVLDKDVNILAKYNKNKLVPFGEFLPFENFFKKFGLKKITQGYSSFSSDIERKIINVNNINFVPLICYEIIYSGNINKSNNDFDLILNISEDGWFGNSVGPYQHFSHSIFRSIEEGKNLIRSANNGISAFIDSKGQIIDQIKSTERGVIEIKSFDQTKKTLFSSFGNKIFFYFLLFYISLFFFLKKKENK
jgi:apolipoprotein N-acyltransferase